MPSFPTVGRRCFRIKSRLTPIAAVFLASFCFASHAIAHDVNILQVMATFDRSGSFQIEADYDVNAWLVGVAGRHLKPEDVKDYLSLSAEAKQQREDELRTFLYRNIKLYFDGAEIDPREADQRFDIAFIPREPMSDEEDVAKLMHPRATRLTGRFPPTAESFKIFCSRSFGNVILRLQVADSKPIIQTLQKGEHSKPFSLQGPQPEQSKWSVAWEFLVSGFRHILPEGWDHIAFVVGLFLLSTHWKPLLWQVTAFTIAHSITLSLAVLKIIHVSQSTLSGIVEPFIALSIAYVAVENIFTSKLMPWRPVVVFAFGLLHGLGFANVLLEEGVPEESYAVALAAFNVGVEFGQLAVILGAFLLVGWFRKKSWYRKAIVIPISAGIAVLGLWVAVERFMG